MIKVVSWHYMSVFKWLLRLLIELEFYHLRGRIEGRKNKLTYQLEK